MGHLVLKYATRNRRHISQTTREWNGYIILSLEGVGLFVMLSEKKCNKKKKRLIYFYHSLIILQPGPTFSEII